MATACTVDFGRISSLETPIKENEFQNENGNFDIFIKDWMTNPETTISTQGVFEGPLLCWSLLNSRLSLSAFDRFRVSTLGAFSFGLAVWFFSLLWFKWKNKFQKQTTIIEVLNWWTTYVRLRVMTSRLSSESIFFSFGCSVGEFNILFFFVVGSDFSGDSRLRFSDIWLLLLTFGEIALIFWPSVCDL